MFENLTKIVILIAEKNRFWKSEVWNTQMIDKLIFIIVRVLKCISHFETEILNYFSSIEYST